VGVHTLLLAGGVGLEGPLDEPRSLGIHDHSADPRDPRCAAGCSGSQWVPGRRCHHPSPFGSCL
jgi:hypothetical protein